MIPKFQQGGLFAQAPTNTLGRFSAVQGPQQIRAAIPNPMDITNLFRAQQSIQADRRAQQADRTLDQRDRSFEEQIRQYNQSSDLRNREFEYRQQKDLFDRYDDMLAQEGLAYKQTMAGTKGSAFGGINPLLYADDISKMTQIQSDAENQMMSLLSKDGMNSKLNYQTNLALSRIQNDTNRKLQNTRMSEISAYSQMYDDYLSSVKKLRDKGLHTNRREVVNLQNNMELTSDPSNHHKMKPSDFDATNATFSREDGTTRMDLAVKNALIGNQEVKVLDASDDARLKGYLATAKTETQRGVAESIANAYQMLKSDKDFMGMVSNGAWNTATKIAESSGDLSMMPEELIKTREGRAQLDLIEQGVAEDMIMSHLNNLRKDEDHRITALQLSRKPVAPSGNPRGGGKAPGIKTPYEKLFGSSPGTEEERATNANMIHLTGLGVDFDTNDIPALRVVGDLAPGDTSYKYFDSNGNEVAEGSADASEVRVYEKPEDQVLNAEGTAMIDAEPVFKASFELGARPEGISTPSRPTSEGALINAEDLTTENVLSEALKGKAGAQPSHSSIAAYNIDLLGEDDVTVETLNKVLNKPPSAVRSNIEELKAEFDKEDEDLRRLEVIETKTGTGRRISADELQELQNLTTRYESVTEDDIIEDRISRTREAINESDEYVGSAIRGLVNSGSVPYGDQDFEFRSNNSKTVKVPGSTESYGVKYLSVEPSSNGKYVVQTKSSGGPAYDEELVWTQDQYREFLKSNSNFFTKESIENLYNEEDINRELENQRSQRMVKAEEMRNKVASQLGGSSVPSYLD